jgi:chromate transporter
MVLPSTLAIIVLFNVFLEYKDTVFVKGMSAAAKPVVVVLIGGVAYSMARSSVFKTMDFGSTNTWIIMGLFVGSLVLFMLGEYIPSFNLHPAIVVVGALLIGGFFIR